MRIGQHTYYVYEPWDKKWFVRCSELIKEDVSLHIHSSIFGKIVAIYVGQKRDGPSVVHKIDLDRIGEISDLFPILDGTWFEIAGRVREMCCECG